MTRDPLPRRLHRRLTTAGALALVLALGACTSVQLPPYTGPAPLPPRAPSGQPATQAPAATPQAPAAAASGVVTEPVPLPPASSAPQTPVAAAELPYSEAVAARFPDPVVNYATPAFQPGRVAYTTDTELQDFLRSLLRRTQPGPTVALLSLGRSQRGLPLEALVFTREANPTPQALLAAGRPTVLLVGQQHGDEPASSEALLVIARQLADGSLRSLLDEINVIVLPRANPDGAQAEQRVTASGIDANRDHLLLRTPEAQAQAQLMRDYRPAVVVDAHEYTVVGHYLEKFGAVQRYDALVQYATTANMPEFITKAAEEWFRVPMVASLAREGYTSEWYYTTSTDPNDRKISMGGTEPDTGRNVNGLKNTVSFLIETRGVGIGRLHFKRRVATHVTAISSILRSTVERAAALTKLRHFVDAEVSALACQGEAVLSAGPTTTQRNLLMLDPVTGADKAVPVTWDSALMLRTLKQRPRPCGYWLAAEASDAVMRLRALGVQVQRIDDTGVVQGESYRETARELIVREDVRGTIADAGGILRVEVERLAALLDVKPGGYYVSLNQPLANLVVAALEPDTQSSYVANRVLSGVSQTARITVPPSVRMVAVP